MTKITVDVEIADTSTVEEAAKSLGVSVPTIWRRIRDKQFVVIRIAGRTLIPQSEIERAKKELDERK